MFFLLYVWSFLTVARAGSHSLMALATYIVGQTPFPEFTVVVMLDDVQIIYYDSVTWKVVHRSHSDSKYYDEVQSDAGIVFDVVYDDLKYWEFKYRDHFNDTDHTGIRVTQRLVGCELLDNDKPGLFKSWNAFDGQNIWEFTFDMKKSEIQNKWQDMLKWDHSQQLHETFLHQNVYNPICIKNLRRFLNIKKNSVMRKVKPRVRLLKKKRPDSQGLQISCLATGFYPRHINLTLFRDAQPVDDDQMTGGEILPNGDRTYQMRKSLIISEEERHEGHEYNCTVTHLNLDNKLSIMFDVSESDPGSFSLVVVISVLVIMCVVVLIITALIRWRKRCAAGRGSETSQSDYSLTPSSAPDEK